MFVANTIYNTQNWWHQDTNICYSFVNTPSVFSRPYWRAYATVLHMSVVCLWRMYCGWTVGPRAQQKLLLTTIRIRIWGIDSYQHEWPWPLFRGRLRLHCQMNLQSVAMRIYLLIDCAARNQLKYCHGCSKRAKVNMA